jgi:hypothetical protein
MISQEFFAIYLVIGISYGVSAIQREKPAKWEDRLAGFLMFAVFWWFFLPTRLFGKYLR